MDRYPPPTVKLDVKTGTSLVVTSVRRCEILVSCLMKIFEKKEISFS